MHVSLEACLLYKTLHGTSKTIRNSISGAVTNQFFVYSGNYSCPNSPKCPRVHAIIFPLFFSCFFCSASTTVKPRLFHYRRYASAGQCAPLTAPVGISPPVRPQARPPASAPTRPRACASSRLRRPHAGTPPPASHGLTHACTLPPARSRRHVPPSRSRRHAAGTPSPARTHWHALFGTPSLVHPSLARPRTPQ